MKNLICFLLALVFLSTQRAIACTTFCLIGKGEVLFGRNYDWTIGYGLIFVNKRGVAKIASAEGSTNPAKWVSKYGSVTFNQYGRESPTGGMNELGLVVEQMWLDGSIYPKDSRPTIGTQEWMQYLLDTAATTAEALKNANALRISSDVTVHYLINDKNGNSATVEFLDGKLVSHTGNQLPIPTLANDTYGKSISYKHAKSWNDVATTSSLDRFTRASVKTEEFARNPKSEQQAVDYAFTVLSNVAQKGFTQWSIVYDQKRGKIYFRTLQSPEIKSIDTRGFDYACSTAVKMLDIDVKEPGDVTTKFADYTRKANRDLIDRSFNGTDFLKAVTARERLGLAIFPESFKCTGGELAEIK
jgi:penicillin V acylase-like amidase (Ntn superfamily)